MSCWNTQRTRSICATIVERTLPQQQARHIVPKHHENHTLEMLYIQLLRPPHPTPHPPSQHAASFCTPTTRSTHQESRSLPKQSSSPTLLPHLLAAIYTSAGVAARRSRISRHGPHEKKDTRGKQRASEVGKMMQCPRFPGKKKEKKTPKPR
jgi:hypothetical protein